MYIFSHFDMLQHEISGIPGEMKSNLQSSLTRFKLFPPKFEAIFLLLNLLQEGRRSIEQISQEIVIR
jgi:hypothetical protein